MKQLEDRTVWDVTTNGSIGELLLLGIACFVLVGMYSLIRLWFKIKFFVKGIWNH